MTRLGYQIPNFTYPGVGPADLFDVVARQAREADASGFDTVLVMDHFYQLPMLGDARRRTCSSATALLSALARETSDVRLQSRSSPATRTATRRCSRRPSRRSTSCRAGGRSSASAPAGSRLEHDAFGIEFGTFTDRFEKLEESLQIVDPDAARRAAIARRQVLHGAATR